MTQTTQNPSERAADIEFGPLSYGAANLGNLYREITDEQAWQILETAWDAGIRAFDTAPHYGLGLSERRLGAFLRTKPRESFVLSTKVGRLLRPNPDGAGTLDAEEHFMVPADLKRVWDVSADGIRHSLDESLERLGLDRVDILYLHDPERSGIDGAVQTGVAALAALREEGLVGAVGIGSMTTDALFEAVETDAVDLLMVAGRYTLVDHSARERVVPGCLRRGVGIVNAAVFNSGLLASSAPGENARYDYGEVPEDLMSRTKEIAAVCARYDVELPAAALQYSLRDPTVRTVVVGGGRPEQVRQNAARVRAPIPERLWADLAEAGLAAQVAAPAQ